MGSGREGRNQGSPENGPVTGLLTEDGAAVHDGKRADHRTSADRDWAQGAQRIPGTKMAKRLICTVGSVWSRPARSSSTAVSSPGMVRGVAAVGVVIVFLRDSRDGWAAGFTLQERTHSGSPARCFAEVGTGFASCANRLAVCDRPDTMADPA